MLGCNDDGRSFKEAAVVSFLILDLVMFSCFFTIAQISELVFSIKDKQGAFSFSGFIFSA